jgi:hypothetical protein
MTLVEAFLTSIGHLLHLLDFIWSRAGGVNFIDPTEEHLMEAQTACDKAFFVCHDDLEISITPK